MKIYFILKCGFWKKKLFGCKYCWQFSTWGLCHVCQVQMRPWMFQINPQQCPQTVKQRDRSAGMTRSRCCSRDGDRPDHLSSGAGGGWTLKGSWEPCDALQLGTPGFLADRGTAEPTRQCLCRSIPQGHSSSFKSEVKMAHKWLPTMLLGKGGDLVLSLGTSSCFYFSKISTSDSQWRWMVYIYCKHNIMQQIAT